jgi:hypothetical protein
MSAFDKDDFLITPRDIAPEENGMPFDLETQAPMVRTIVNSLLLIFETWEKIPEDLRAEIIKSVNANGSAYSQLPPIEKQLLDMQQAGVFIKGRDVNGKWLSDYRLELIAQAKARGEETNHHGPNCACGETTNHVTGALLDLYEVDDNFRELMTQLRGPLREQAKMSLDMTKIFATRMETYLRRLGHDEKVVRYYTRKSLSALLVEDEEETWTVVE